MAINIYGGQSWYAERPEPEEDFDGRLDALPVIAGPGNRPSLSFMFRTADDELAVYSAGVQDRLRTLVGTRPRIRGKVVDLTGEGGTRELWIATIAPAGGE